MSKLVVGGRLRRMRIEAGLQGKELAGILGWQASKVTRIEQGKQTPSLHDLEQWCLTCNHPESEVQTMMGLLTGPTVTDPEQEDPDEPIPHMIGISISDHTMTRLLNYAVINGFTAEEAIVHLLGLAAGQRS